MSHPCKDLSKVSPSVASGESTAATPSNSKKKKRAEAELSTGFPEKGHPGSGGKRSRGGVNHAPAYSGAFRDNIRRFLEESGQQHSTEVCLVGGFTTWQTLISTEAGNFPFSLYTVEENVAESSQTVCDSCRCAGWSHHFVSKRRYHLIIPREGEWSNPVGASTLDLDTHLLHGMIHCNGFGHLLCVTGKEEGPNPVSTDEIMDLWDYICTVLRVRKISVKDLSRKETMDVRLLYGLAYGQSWLSKWGYKFCRGSFGVAEDKYNRAIEVLSSIDLDGMVKDMSEGIHGKVIESIVGSYREASKSPLVTISDLLQFLIDPRPQTSRVSKRKVDPFRSMKNNDGKNSAEEDKDRFIKVRGPLISRREKEAYAQRWPVRRLEHVAKVIANTLKDQDLGRDGMARQELRDSVRMYIGDTGLIDFVLKHIDGTIVGNQVIRRWVNPKTRTLEFLLKEISSAIKEVKLESVEDCPQDFNVTKDILCLYESVLYGYPERHMVSLSTQTVLDCKHFVKDWPLTNFWEGENKLMNVLCIAAPGYHELITEFTRPLPPGDLIRIHKCTDITEIKLAAQEALRDTYFVTDQYLVTEVKTREMGPGAMPVYYVSGIGLDSRTKLRYEGGPDNWVVNCLCGARDDDGEKMVACDACQVCQHALCNGIEHEKDMPGSTFICKKCG